MLISTEKPFVHRDRRKMVDKIMQGDYQMEGPVWDQVSDASKDFVR
jgi:hypothetical protein